MERFRSVLSLSHFCPSLELTTFLGKHRDQRTLADNGIEERYSSPETPTLRLKNLSHETTECMTAKWTLINLDFKSHAKSVNMPRLRVFTLINVMTSSTRPPNLKSY